VILALARSRVRLVALALLTLGLAVGLVGAGIVPAFAAPNGPAIEITVIHASQTDGGVSIDPSLRDLPQLTRDQPFVRYNTYKLLGRQALPLEVGKAATSDLPNGRALAVTLVEPPTSTGPRPRYHVRAEIGEPGKKAFLKLLEVTATGNEPFFVGGQSYQGGTLFLELVVRP
jgi:hypothetical protein